MTRIFPVELLARLQQLNVDITAELVDKAALREALTVPPDQLEAELVAEGVDLEGGARRFRDMLRETNEGALQEAFADDLNVEATPAFRIVNRLLENLEKWRGCLSSWEWVSMVPANAHLPADVARRKIVGVQKALHDIFDSETLRDDLSWSDGVLRIMCEQTADGPIRKITGSVRRKENAIGNSSIILCFSDRYGSTETLELTPALPMRTANNLSLRGEVANIELVVSLQRIK